MKKKISVGSFFPEALVVTKPMTAPVWAVITVYAAEVEEFSDRGPVQEFFKHGTRRRTDGAWDCPADDPSAWVWDLSIEEACADFARFIDEDTEGADSIDWSNGPQAQKVYNSRSMKA